MWISISKDEAFKVIEGVELQKIDGAEIVYLYSKEKHYATGIFIYQVDEKAWIGTCGFWENGEVGVEETGDLMNAREVYRELERKAEVIMIKHKLYHKFFKEPELEINPDLITDIRKGW